MLGPVPIPLKLVICAGTTQLDTVYRLDRLQTEEYPLPFAVLPYSTFPLTYFHNNHKSLQNYLPFRVSQHFVNLPSPSCYPVYIRYRTQPFIAAFRMPWLDSLRTGSLDVSKGSYLYSHSQSVLLTNTPRTTVTQQPSHLSA